MSSSRKGPVRTFFGRLWWLIDATRRTVFNLLFLAIVVVAIVAWTKSGPPPLAEKTALVLDLHGTIAEQKSGNLRQSALNQVRGDTGDKVQLRDVRSVLAAAAADPKIERVVLVLDELDGAGPATLHEIASALDRFRAAGKQVIAWGSSYDQRQYYLAAHADQVLLHPLGMVFIEGYGRYRNYYKDALDKIGVRVNLMKVGTYKSAAEPYIANEASPAAREADGTLLNALWSGYTENIETARKLPRGSIGALIDDLPKRLAAASGDAAKLALNEKLVDGLKTRDELRALLIERGARDEEGKTFRQVSFGEYLNRVRPKTTGDAVGVVVAEGEIVDGLARPGTVGGLSTSQLIRKAREDDRIKAIVLRVNSPGGSVFGSELVRRELEVTRAAGKPIIVSMGDLAASGGYWISMAADEVIADASTITGSIGVFGLLPTADQAFDKLGIHTDGVTTTWLGGARDPRRPLDPRFAELVQANIDHTYADFTAKVAQARKTTPDKIDAVAQGRVWTGTQALERGLVDRIGSYGDALDAAATRAKLGKDYRVAYLERDPGRFARIVELLDARLASAIGASVAAPMATLSRTWLGGETSAELVRDLGELADVASGKRPFATLVHCFCGAP